MGSMHTGLEETSNGFQKMAAYFAERAKGQVGLIVTGGIAPNRAGWVSPFSAKMSTAAEARHHRIITDAVHSEDGKICMQVLHAGRYGYHPLAVSPSGIKSPITPFKPWTLSQRGIRRTIRDFANTAALAQDAGYDGIEIMGSEGYLINQFIASRTNHRKDEWGGSYENRIRFPLEILRQVRERTSDKFILIYRLSMLDLVDEGSSWEEVEYLAQQVEAAGVNIINTGIGWHEARVPTIATMVPRGGFAWVTKRLMGKVNIPLITTNRINSPETAENILREGCANMVSMARPFLADPDLVKKAITGRFDEINTCIACNQACLDHIFKRKVASCLVNPRACRETELNYLTATVRKKIAVVGAGPAGLSTATIAAQRGHEVHLFEKAADIGGQFNMAKQIPGKEEFYETLRYYRRQLEITGVHTHFNTIATTESLLGGGFDEVIIATGVYPRKVSIPGDDHPKVLSYIDVLSGHRQVGKKVAIIGAGGIGFDVAAYLLHGKSSPSTDISVFAKEWGIDIDYTHRGAIEKPAPEAPEREIHLLQRTKGKPGEKLGKTTGWIHRATLKMKKVRMWDGVTYQRIDDEGLHLEVAGKSHLLAVDHIILCAGQVSCKDLYEPLQGKGIKVHLIGGAKEAGELDAKRAIEEGARLAAAL
jgi:2,4-dienoyl-CoA reductase (NADPH2)